MTESPQGDDKKRNIYLLGLVSLLNDASSEIIQPILPLFIASLGAGGVAIGLIGGLALRCEIRRRSPEEGTFKKRKKKRKRSFTKNFS